MTPEQRQQVVDTLPSSFRSDLDLGIEETERRMEEVEQRVAEEKQRVVEEKQRVAEEKRRADELAVKLEAALAEIARLERERGGAR